MPPYSGRSGRGCYYIQLMCIACPARRVTPAGSSRTARTAACSTPILEKLSGALGEFDEVALGHLFMFDEAGDLCAYDAVDIALIGDVAYGFVLAAEVIHQQVQQLLSPLHMPLIFLSKILGDGGGISRKH